MAATHRGPVHRSSRALKHLAVRWKGRLLEVLTEGRPCERMHATLLVGALCDLRSAREAVRNDVLEWVRGAPADIPFDDTCDYLGLPLEDVRRDVIAYAEEVPWHRTARPTP